MRLNKRVIVRNFLVHLYHALKVFLFFVFFLLFICHRFRDDPRPPKFSGVVTDKWIFIAETQEGSKPVPVVTIRTDDGRLRNIVVDPENYARLGLSMRVRRDLKSVEPVAAP
ncbi:MAG: hypothetical protein JSS81_30015 [Acidobacteria bacterium]|nr:hypothetical protein [Acidobacteriota bacterium]